MPYEVINTNVLSRGFPAFPVPFMPRDNLLNLIDDILSTTIDAVVVDGVHGVGTTTLLAHFASVHKATAVSLFLRPASRFAYDPDVLLYDVCNQLNFILNGKELENVEPSEALMRAQVLACARRWRSSKQLQFVVDGLCNIPGDRTAIRDTVLGWLPFGLAPFKVVLSGSELLTVLEQRQVVARPLTVPSLSKREAEELLGRKLSPGALAEIWTITKGIPEYVIAVRRLLEHSDPDSVLANLPATAPQLYEVEWKRSEFSDTACRAIALTAFSDAAPTLVEAATLLKIEAEALRKELEACSFLQLREGCIEFVTDTFRAFAKSRLAHLQAPIEQLLADSLLLRPDTPEALVLLPKFLQKQGRSDELLAYVTAERLELMVRRSQMRAPAEAILALSVDAAHREHKESELVRLSILACELRDFSMFRASSNDVEALLALGDYDAALALANAATLRGDRLGLLATIARTKKEAGLVAEPALLEQIEDLVKTYEVRSAREAGDVAADLLYTRPDLALRLIEAAEQSAGTGDQLDWARARISVEATAAGYTDQTSLEKLQRRIQSPEVGRLARALSLLARQYSASELIAELDRIPAAADKLYLLRQWARHARPNLARSSDAGTLLRLALDIAVATPEYSPTATHLRELSSALRLVDESDVPELTARLSTLAESVREVGPSEDYVRLQLAIAERIGPQAGTQGDDRVLDAYLYALDIADLSVHASCMAHFAAMLQVIDPSAALERAHGLHSDVQRCLDRDVAALLSQTADHVVSLGRIVTALARNRLSEAIRVASLLNVEPRRDQARASAIDAHLAQSAKKIDLRGLAGALTSFESQAARDAALLAVLDRLVDVRSDQVLKDRVTELRPLLVQAGSVQDEGLLAPALAAALAISTRSGALIESEMAQGKTLLADKWGRLDDNPVKLDLGYRLAATLAPWDRDASREFVRRCDSLKKTVGSHDSARTLVYAIRLAVRAFSALAAVGKDATDDLANIVRRIQSLPSHANRVALWSSLSLSLVDSGRSRDAHEMVDGRIRPALAELEVSDSMAWREALIHALPALHAVHHGSALELLGRLKGEKRDEACLALLDYLLYGLAPKEPYEERAAWARPVSYACVLDVLELMPYLDSDALTYVAVERTCRSIERASKYKFTKQQRESIHDKLAAAVATLLPNPRFIRHEGYLISSLAQIYQLRRHETRDWDALVSRAKALPSAADIPFVLALIADAHPDSRARGSIIATAKAACGAIASPVDRSSRLYTLASVASREMPAVAKQCLKEALAAGGDQDGDDDGLRRQIVDLAYTIEPEWASNLASELDNDPARRKARKEVESHLRSLSIKRSIADEKYDEGGSADLDELPRVAWMLLGSMNSGRLGPTKLKMSRGFLRAAARLPLSRSYPIVAWSIENARLLLRDKEEGIEILRGILDATLLGCDFASRLWGISGSAEQAHVALTGHAGGVVVRSGQREVAMSCIREFLQRHCDKTLKIADPYLGPAEVCEILRLVRACGRRPDVVVITSHKHFSDSRVPHPWGEAVERAWRQVSDETAPNLTIVVAGVGAGGKSPVHDRWWLADTGGLRVGTSFGSLGAARDSEISEIPEAERRQLLGDFDEYAAGRRRAQGGERISYASFTL